MEANQGSVKRCDALIVPYICRFQGRLKWPLRGIIPVDPQLSRADGWSKVNKLSTMVCAGSDIVFVVGKIEEFKGDIANTLKLASQQSSSRNNQIKRVIFQYKANVRSDAAYIPALFWYACYSCLLSSEIISRVTAQYSAQFKSSRLQ